MEDEGSLFWWSVIMSKQSWPPPPIFLMILTEESRVFPLKQLGCGGGTEVLQSAARGRMEKLVQTCLRDRGGGGCMWRERVERERERNWFITNNRFYITVLLWMRGSNKIKLKRRGEREKTETALDENESGFRWQEALKPDLLFTSLSPASSLILTGLHLCL